MFDLGILTTKEVLEWTGASISLAGAFLLSINNRFSRYGWLAFLAANVIMIAWGLSIEARGFVLQQLGFAVTSLIGLYKTGLLPFLAKTQNAG